MRPAGGIGDGGSRVLVLVAASATAALVLWLTYRASRRRRDPPEDGWATRQHEAPDASSGRPANSHASVGRALPSVEHDPQQNPQQYSDRSEDSLSDSALAPLTKQKPGALTLDLGVVNMVDVSGSRSPPTEFSPDLGTESPGALTPRTPGMNPRRFIKTGERKMSQVRAFSPKLALWELARHHPGELVEPGAFDFESALLFIDISGFTPLCTKLDIDVLQKHINTFFGILIDVVSQHDGDVLRFAGDALYCAWSLPCGAADEGTLALATLAACRCALELHEKCSSYLIDERAIDGTLINQTLSMCVPSPPPPRGHLAPLLPWLSACSPPWPIRHRVAA